MTQFCACGEIAGCCAHTNPRLAVSTAHEEGEAQPPAPVVKKGRRVKSPRGRKKGKKGAR